MRFYVLFFGKKWHLGLLEGIRAKLSQVIFRPKSLSKCLCVRKIGLTELSFSQVLGLIISNLKELVIFQINSQAFLALVHENEVKALLKTTKIKAFLGQLSSEYL